MINKTAFWFSLTLITAFVFKYLHAISHTADLMFILWPISSLIELIFTAKAVYQDTGFYFPELNILIDKSCSGFNFFIVSFCVFSATAPYYLFERWKPVLLFLGVTTLSYTLTIVVNTLRISGAILLFEIKPVIPGIKLWWLYKAEGIFISLFILFLSYRIIKNCFIRIKNYYIHRTKSHHEHRLWQLHN